MVALRQPMEPESSREPIAFASIVADPVDSGRHLLEASCEVDRIKPVHLPVCGSHSVDDDSAYMWSNGSERPVEDQCLHGVILDFCRLNCNVEAFGLFICLCWVNADHSSGCFRPKFVILSDVLDDLMIEFVLDKTRDKPNSIRRAVANTGWDKISVDS